MQLAVFEDEAYRNFLPLAYTHPLFELKCGMYSLRERAELELGRAQVLYAREHLAPKLRLLGYRVNEQVEGELLLLNARVVAGSKLKSRLASMPQGYAAFAGGALAYAKLPPSLASRVAELLSEARVREAVQLVKRECIAVEPAARLVEYPWELVGLSAELLAGDIMRLDWSSQGEVDESVRVIGEGGFHVAKGARVEAYVVADTRGGPVYVDSEAVVESFSLLKGPLYIGRKTIVFPSLLDTSYIGEVCRIGGEVSHSVFHGYSNKRHYGFIGHSYIGMWVNMGAGSTNSNLKNTYGPVRVEAGGRKVDTGRQFVGCYIADHVKTSIGAMIFCRKVGVASHVYGAATRDIPSFTAWITGAEPVELELKGVLETARRMMARRGVALTREDEQVLRHVYQETVGERRALGVRKGRVSLQPARRQI